MRFLMLPCTSQCSELLLSTLQSAASCCAPRLDAVLHQPVQRGADCETNKSQPKQCQSCVCAPLLDAVLHQPVQQAALALTPRLHLVQRLLLEKPVVKRGGSVHGSLPRATVHCHGSQRTIFPVADQICKQAQGFSMRRACQQTSRRVGSAAASRAMHHPPACHSLNTPDSTHRSLRSGSSTVVKSSFRASIALPTTARAPASIAAKRAAERAQVTELTCGTSQPTMYCCRAARLRLSSRRLSSKCQQPDDSQLL